MSIKSIFFIFTIFFFLEIFSRYGHLIFPYEDHQRYGYTQNKTILKIHPFQKINGRAAIGMLFKGAKKNIAFFGTSSLFDGVPMNKTWPELLKKASNNTIHIDNFGFFSESVKTLNKKFESLCKLKRYYAFAIIQLSHVYLANETLSYQNRFTPEKKGVFKSYQLIKKWHSRSQYNTSSLFKFFNKKPTYLIYDLEETTALKGNREFLSQNVFVDNTTKIDSKTIAEIASLIEGIIEKSYCISKTVFWLTEPFAWSKSMLKSYEDIYYHLEEVHTGNQPLFASNKSLGLYMKKQKEIIKNIVQKQTKEIVFIDLFNFIQKEISVKSDLFIDDSHLSEKGHESVFRFLLPTFLRYIPELQKTIK